MYCVTKDIEHSRFHAACDYSTFIREVAHVSGRLLRKRRVPPSCLRLCCVASFVYCGLRPQRNHQTFLASGGLGRINADQFSSIWHPRQWVWFWVWKGNIHHWRSIHNSKLFACISPWYIKSQNIQWLTFTVIRCNRQWHNRKTLTTHLGTKADARE